MRAADDFAVIRARMVELQRERDAIRKDNEERIRHMGNGPIEEARKRSHRTLE